MDTILMNIIKEISKGEINIFFTNLRICNAWKNMKKLYKTINIKYLH